jgi:uncharacterized protein (DUF1778 family)
MPARSARAKRSTRSEKLDLRLTPAAKRRIEAAADVQNKSLTEFVLDSALSTADALLADRRTFHLNAEQWKAFMEALDAPPRYHERLERLLTEPGVFD